MRKLLKHLTKILNNEERLTLGTLLIAGINKEKANDRASWDSTQDAVEQYHPTPEQLREVSKSLDTLSHRMKERAEDIEIENKKP
jgi:hypothetical protein